MLKASLFILRFLVDYGRQLLYRREDDRFIIKNDSILPILWKIRNAQDFIEDFIIAQTSGIVQRHDNQVVPVTYIACRVGVISNKIMIIDVRSKSSNGGSFPLFRSVVRFNCFPVLFRFMMLRAAVIL